MMFFRVLFMVFGFSLVCQASAQDSLRIAVASNFIVPMKHIKIAFEKEHDIQLIVAFGSSGKLFAQIVHGAPFSVFMSADKEKPALLVERQIAMVDSQQTYARGRLALITRKASPPRPFLMLEDTTLAIANPKLAPYGRAALETLTALNVDRNSLNLVTGENISQAFQFAFTGNADVGFIAFSQALDNPILTAEQIWVVPSTLHQPIQQDLVVIEQSDAATKFVTFLMRPDTQHYIQSQGYQ